MSWWKEVLILAVPIGLCVGVDAVLPDPDADAAAARSFYARLAEAFPQSGETLVNWASAAYRVGSPAEAEEAFQRAFATDPELFLARVGVVHFAFLRGLEAAAAGQLETASAAYGEAVAAYPTTSGGPRAIGSAVAAADQLPYPRLANVRANWGSVLSGLGRIEEAREQLVLAVDARPDLAAGWFNRGLVEFGAERFREADQCFQRVLELEPADGEAARWQAESRRRTRNP